MVNTQPPSEFPENGGHPNNCGWHVEIVPGVGSKRISNKPRLATTHPHLAAQWHPHLNGECTPQTVTALSNKRVWWLCTFGHAWNRQISSRTTGNSGCPDCELESESVAFQYPDLLKQWSKKNGTVDPRKVRVTEGKTFWWTCPELLHDDFQQSVLSRLKAKDPLSCPFCEGRLPAQSLRPLAVTHVKIAKYWHPVKNGSLTANDVTAHSRRRVWWICEKNPEHEWLQNVYRQLTHQCKFCQLEKFNLSLLEPELAKEWHPSKNGNLTPNMVSPGSGQIVWWQCQKFSDHVWKAAIDARARQKRGCRFCANRLVDSRNSLARKFPKVAAEWHPTKNLPLTPDRVTSGSSRKAWWQCKTCELTWEAKIDQRTRALTGCPACARVNDNNNLAKLYPEVAAQWHPTKNGHLFPSWDPTSSKRMKETGKKNRRLRPSDFAAGSNHVAWWQCEKSKFHVWETAIANRTLGGHGCAFCTHQRVALDNSLAAKNKNLAKRWHPTRNLPLTPEQVTEGSTKVVWWRCFRSAVHVWQQSVAVVKRAYATKHSGCPFCTSRKLGKDNHLAAKYPKLAIFWHPTRNSPLTPDSVMPNAKRIVWWQCPKFVHHVWKANLGNMVTRWKHKKGVCCSFCSGDKVTKEDSLAALYPELLKYWDKARNLGITPKKVGPKSSKVVHWRCPKSADHRWALTIRGMVTRRVKCHFCGQKG